MANNSDVAHAWAHNHQKFYSGSNFTHNPYGELRSYNTVIGQRIELDGNIIFIIDNNRYSSSTSKHQCCMRSAIPQDDDNTYVFCAPAKKFGRACFAWTLSAEQRKKDLIIFGLQILASGFLDCIRIVDCKKLNGAFSPWDYNEMQRFFKVTGVTTVKKLLKMKAADFSDLAWKAVCDMNTSYAEQKIAEKSLRKFLKMLSEGADTPTITDAIVGKGTWEAYMKRTAGLRAAAKNRRLEAFIGTNVNARVRKKHGDSFLQWAEDMRKLKAEEKTRLEEIRQRQNRVRAARERLEKYCGMQGWSGRYSWHASFTTFDYNGTVIDFHKSNGYCERRLSDTEYLEFIKCEDKAGWIHAKRQWMLEQLQEDDVRYKEFAKRQGEYIRLDKLENERQRKLSERTEYINETLEMGDEGYRKLYHEGFSINLPHQNPGVFNGGNALLRYNPIRKIVETSKGIKMNVDECKRLWKIFQCWHNHTELCQKGLGIMSLSGFEYHVHSFENDVLTAGCHKIAFSEMQYIANELKF